MIIYVDIDETICEHPISEGPRDYSKAKPLTKRIDKINNLFDEGNVFLNIGDIFKYHPNKNIKSEVYYHMNSSFVKEYSYNLKTNNFGLVQNNNLITPFAILFLVEIFPVKTTGSFFTTGNATYIFFLIAVIIALSRKSQYNWIFYN